LLHAASRPLTAGAAPGAARAAAIDQVDHVARRALELVEELARA
jgi:hypothetical protein